jgi:[CysO sulfur-carrier protein]-S-L-cysteine hydrolase
VPVRLTREHLEQMLAQARAEAPKECCGFLLGTGDLVAEVVPVRNAVEELGLGIEGPELGELDPEAARDPRRTYRMDPLEQLRADRMAFERGCEIVAIYHSHPATRAYPSATDQAAAKWFEPRYVIISLADADRPDVRAFRITEPTDSNGTRIRNSKGQIMKHIAEEDVVVI